MKNKIQLITYVDRLACKNIKELKSLFENELKGLFGGVHILPFFYPTDGADAGFDPIDHSIVDPRLGDWHDIKDLSKSVDIMADMIVNHISAKSEQYIDYLQKADKSEYAAMFLTFDKIFPEGATETDLTKIYRPRPGLPFTSTGFKDDTKKLVWTTFTSSQIDIDVYSRKGEEYLEGILKAFEYAGIKMIRLDAAGYAVKRKGTSCFMIDETFDYIADLSQKAKKRGMEVLVEVHSHYKTQIEIAGRVDYVYDFALPVLVLDTLFNKNTANLKGWLKIRPENAFTVLDTHDGIGIIDVASECDKPGLIADDVLNAIVNTIHLNNDRESLKATGTAASNLDLYQINCTYFNALARDEFSYLTARAIQFFIPGIPQVYYVGLFAGENDMDLLARTNVGRDINRHYYKKNEIKKHLNRPIIKKLMEIMQLRNEHPAFSGSFSLIETPDDILNIKWTLDNQWAELYIHLVQKKMQIQFSAFNKVETITFDDFKN